MKLIARCQLTGSYGTVYAGQTFETDDQTALHLMRNNMAHKADPPKIEYEVQAIRPQEAPEVSPREPFRDSNLPYEEPAQLAPESNRILPQPDLPTAANADHRRRRGRPRSGS